ncbi:hypothetical protein EYF80_019594 [Liparis tanakae]|uniref:Uncharacterized protein n=1 Tax=Liparis tanakae TaxID=230148 RepID=A0A4Z2HZ13_9TELE|nr:hypothetical protein EYF80_019594 [Liparis tanakae]
MALGAPPPVLTPRRRVHVLKDYRNNGGLHHQSFRRDSPLFQKSPIAPLQPSLHDPLHPPPSVR